MKGMAAQQNFKAKTDNLTAISFLSGYATDFSNIINNDLVPVTPIEDAIAAAIAESGEEQQ